LDQEEKASEREKDTLMEKMVALIQSAPFCCAKLNLRPFSAASTPDHAALVFAIHCTSFKSSSRAASFAFCDI
jgi:CRISPR/Cas system-associated protein Csm6